MIDDHKAPPPDVDTAEQVAQKRRFVKDYGITHWFEYGRHGILHQRFPETGYVVPGDLVAMSDSHSTTYGAFNAMSTPINMESIYVIIKGQRFSRLKNLLPKVKKVLLRCPIKETRFGLKGSRVLTAS